MIESHLKTAISELDQKIAQIPCDSEKAQLQLALHTARVSVNEGGIRDADEILSAIHQRVEFLMNE